MEPRVGRVCRANTQSDLGIATTGGGWSIGRNSIGITDTIDGFIAFDPKAATMRRAMIVRIAWPATQVLCGNGQAALISVRDGISLPVWTVPLPHGRGSEGRSRRSAATVIS